MLRSDRFVVGLAALVLGAGAAEAQTCGNCTATTTHSYLTGRTVTVVATQTQSGPAPASASATSAIGTSSVTAKTGELGLGLSLQGSAGSNSTIAASASFTDRLTFDFGDNGLHTISVPVSVSGNFLGPATNGLTFQARFDFAGDFAHQTPFNRQLYQINDNVTAYAGQSDSADRTTQSGAIGTWVFTGDSAVNSGFTDAVTLRSGAAYDVTYQLYTSQTWNGSPLTIDLTHTLLAGPYSGAGLLGVNSASQGMLIAAPGGGFGYAAAIAAVPEPEGWAMLILGFGVAGGMLRRRRSARDQQAVMLLPRGDARGG